MYLELRQKKIWAQFSFNIFTQKTVTKLTDWIQYLEKTYSGSQIWIQGSKKHRILSTAPKKVSNSWHTIPLNSLFPEPQPLPVMAADHKQSCELLMELAH
jgi:hypothetical protein